MLSRKIILITLVLIAAVFVALAGATTVVASENPMSLAQHNRMNTVANTMWLVFLLMQIPIVWLVTSVWAYRRRLQIPLSLLTSLACSLCVGVLLFLTAEHGWYSIASQFK